MIAAIFSNNGIANRISQNLEYKANTDIFEDTLSYEYGIVLGGYSGYNKTYNMVEFNNASDRILYTLQLYHQQKIKKIVLVGGSGRLAEQNLKESDKVNSFVLKMGVDSSDIIVETNSRNTYENARNTKNILGHDTSSCILITSALHMKRALGCFHKQGIPAIPYPVDFMTEYDTKFKLKNILGFSFDNFSNWNTIIKEQAGYRIYKMKGYL